MSIATARTAIVVGATGLVGRALVEQLVDASHVDRVVTITRRPVGHASPKITNRVVDFERLEEHADAFRGEWLFSALGTTRKEAGSVDAQRRVDLDYQLAAARLAAANGARHYLLVSSSFADATSGNAYLRMKGELEQQVLTLPFERISIFQPSVLIGKRDRSRAGEEVGGFVMRALRIVPGLRRYRPIRGEQVAARMVQASREPGPAVEWFRLDDIFPRGDAPASGRGSSDSGG